MNQKHLSFIFFFLSFSLIFVGSGFSATVFGPKDLTVNRYHYHYSHHTFTVDAAGKGELTVTRTTPDKKIRGGFIIYNFRMIPLRKFFRKDQETLTRKIRLRAKNRIFVFLRGEPGAAISVEVREKGKTNPPEAQLSAEPESILQGQSSSLTWSTSHADSVVLEPEIGTVDPTGTISVSPNETTVYTLTARGTGGTATAQAEVQVTLLAPTVTITSEPDTIAPGKSSTLTWSSEHAVSCTIEPDIDDIPVNGSIDVVPSETTTYTITAVGPGGTAQAQALVQLYPIKIQRIDKSQAHYTTPENTVAAASSALLKHDLDWYYNSLTSESAANSSKSLNDAGIEQERLFDLVDENDEEYIVERKMYKDGILLITENKANDIDGTILRGPVVLVLEDDLWKATFKYGGDEELHQYMDVQYANCIARYRFPLIDSDFTDDSCNHNHLTNHNQTAKTVDQRNGEEQTVAAFNGINNGFSREPLNDMPREQISMGGWIKADSIDHTARIMEIGRDRNDSTAIVLDPGKGLRYWIHVDGRRVERTAAMDYDFHDNQWHHVYLTYDGAVMKLYVDAQLKDSYPVSGTIDSAAVLNIGQHNGTVFGGTSNTFKGRLDDLQIYNKPLTAEEILAKYENGTS